MKLAWIRWAGGIHTRDDGYSIYQLDYRGYLLKRPNGTMQRFRSLEEAKRVVSKEEIQR